MLSRHRGESTQCLPAVTIEQFEASIRGRLGARVSDLRVVARGEGLILQGRSRTHHARRLAQPAAIAIEIAELHTLDSEIRA